MKIDIGDPRKPRVGGEKCPRPGKKGEKGEHGGEAGEKTKKDSPQDGVEEDPVFDHSEFAGEGSEEGGDDERDQKGIEEEGGDLLIDGKMEKIKSYRKVQDRVALGSRRSVDGGKNPEGVSRAGEGESEQKGEDEDPCVGHSSECPGLEHERGGTIRDPSSEDHPCGAVKKGAQREKEEKEKEQKGPNENVAPHPEEREIDRRLVV